MVDQRNSDNDVCKRDIPSFIEPRPPLIQNPFMRPRPQKGTNLLELFEDSETDEPELVQVYLRLRPCDVASNLYEVRSDRCLITSLDSATAGHGRRTQHKVFKMYTFSKIFQAACNQKEIFEEVVKDNLRKLPDGQNFTLLTYGASGSGKTYTLMGTVGSPGLVPRSLEYVFRLVDAAQQPAYKPAEGGAQKLSYSEQEFELKWVKKLRSVSAPLRDKYRRMSTQLCNEFTASNSDLSKKTKYYVWVSFVEIYNEAIYDLLAPLEKRNKLRIREDSSGHVYVKGATQAFVKSGEEAYDVMVAGKHNLVVAATGVHAHSSRSHCIFTITMLTEVDGDLRSSCIRLCDLAGCERASATRNTGARMQESRAINSSLHVLERCLHMLRRKQRQGLEGFVPYRESKLTRLLGPGLSGARGEAVSMVVTLNPSPQYAHETKHVLSLATVAQDIQVNNTMLTTTLESSVQDSTMSASMDILKLRVENERLHFELAQAQSHITKLRDEMEVKQLKAGDMMRELVEEAKNFTAKYYEAQLEALREDMRDMKEEYEEKLKDVSVPTSSNGTPSRDKIAKLKSEIADLQEKLTAERISRAQTEKELQQLRTFMEEDGKAFGKNKDVIVLTDSDEENDDVGDPLNESLEPLFRRETINRSLAFNSSKILECDEIETDEESTEDDSRSNDDLITKSDQSDSNLKLTCPLDTNKSLLSESAGINLTSNLESINIAKEAETALIKTITPGNQNKADDNCLKFQFNDEASKEFFISENSNIMTKNVSNSNDSGLITSIGSGQHSITADNFAQLTNNVDDLIETVCTDINNDERPKNTSSYFDKALITSHGSVKASISDDNFSKLTFHDDEIAKDNLRTKTGLMLKTSSNNSDSPLISSIINEYHNVSDDKLPDLIFNENKFKVDKSKTENKHKDAASKPLVKNLVDSFESKAVNKNFDVFKKPPEGLLVNKILKNLKESQSSDSSLLQFEQLEKATKNYQSPERKFSYCSIALLKEKRHFFDSSSGESNCGKDDVDKNCVSNVTTEPKQNTVNTETKEIVTVCKEPNENADINSIIGKELGDIKLFKENRTYFDLNVIDSVIASNENKTETFNTEVDLKTMTNNLNASVSDINNSKDKRLFDVKDSIVEIPSVRGPNTSNSRVINITGFDKDGRNISVGNFKENDSKQANVTLDENSSDKRTYFDNIDINLDKKSMLAQNIDERTFTVHEEIAKIVFKQNTTEKLLEESIQTSKITSKSKHDSIDVFEDLSPNGKDVIDVGVATQLAENLTINANNNQADKDVSNNVTSLNSKISDNFKEKPQYTLDDIQVNDTMDAFENIYKNISVARTTDFEMLITDVSSNDVKNATNSLNDDKKGHFDLESTKDEIIQQSSIKNNEESAVGTESSGPKVTDNSEVRSNDTVPEIDDEAGTQKGLSINTKTTKSKKNTEVSDDLTKQENRCEESTYNLRRKVFVKTKNINYDHPTASSESKDEILLDNQEKGANTNTRKRNLRLRRHRNVDIENSDVKMKDIVNLQTEFSDVTLDRPAVPKVVLDIPTPEKQNENEPPSNEIQTCPSKSVTRSRRKLFTPRAEPLDESAGRSGDSHERIRVPRPSYHKPRARRKL